MSLALQGSVALVAGGTRGAGRGIAVQVDHLDSGQVRALVERIDREQRGRLDVLVNDIWGGDPLTEWGVPFWKHSLENGLALHRRGIETHLITSWHAVPLMVARASGLILEVTDGVESRYRGSLCYDLVKSSVICLALAQAEELRPHGITAVALTPGYLRSEAMLDHFGVTEATWRDAVALSRPRVRVTAWGRGTQTKHSGASKGGQ